MIIIDKTSPPNEEGGVFVPVGIYETKDGADIYVHPDFEDTAKEFCEKYADLFSPEALAFAEEKIKEKAEKLGFFRDKSDIGRIYFDYTCEKAPDSELILPGTVRLTPEGAKKLCPELEICSDFSRDLLFFATVIGDRIVSAACENGASDSNISEIETETSPLFRRRGYAASNTAALITEQLLQKRRISYIVRDDNFASVSLAGKLGMTRERKIYYYDCCRGI